MTSKVGGDSPAVEEASGGGPTGGGVRLKKGPWTSAEDAVLVDYVTKHGEGNWSAVQKHSGLSRCGKSCRLRWANHLRPNLKKGSFSPEEERRILELHAKMGSKWSRMASELPGRTDNDIKNYWNTRIKRRLRAGLAMYPPDICLQAFSVNKQRKDQGTFSSTCSHPEFLPINRFEVSAMEFKTFELSQQLYPPALLNIAANSFLDIPSISLQAQGLNSSCNTRPVLSTMHPSKCIGGSESWLSGLDVDFFQACHQRQNDGSLLEQSLEFSSQYTHNLTSDHHPSFSGVFPGSHAPFNGNSSSEPKWAKKLELPSLQTQMASWGSPTPLPSLETYDSLIQSPPSEHTYSGSLSPRNSGLLDAVLYESQTFVASKNNSHKETCDVLDDSCPDLQETQWGTYSDPNSPLGQSAPSVCSEHTPIFDGLSHEPGLVATVFGCKVKQEKVDLAPTDMEYGISNHQIFSRIESCFGPTILVPQQNRVRTIWN